MVDSSSKYMPSTGLRSPLVDIRTLDEDSLWAVFNQHAVDGVISAGQISTMLQEAEIGFDEDNLQASIHEVLCWFLFL